MSEYSKEKREADEHAVIIASADYHPSSAFAAAKRLLDAARADLAEAKREAADLRDHAVDGELYVQVQAERDRLRELCERACNLSFGDPLWHAWKRDLRAPTPTAPPDAADAGEPEAVNPRDAAHLQRICRMKVAGDAPATAQRRPELGGCDCAQCGAPSRPCCDRCQHAPPSQPRMSDADVARVLREVAECVSGVIFTLGATEVPMRLLERADELEKGPAKEGE